MSFQCDNRVSWSPNETHNPAHAGGSEFGFCLVAEGKPPPRIALAREQLLIIHLHLGLLLAITDDYDAEFAADSDSLAYFAKSCMASSASTLPVMEIGTKGAFAAISALEIMI